MSTHRLTHAHLDLLANFYELGGSCELDRDRRLIGGIPPRQMAGDTGIWLVLVALGMVGGEDGKLMLTELGRQVAGDEVVSRKGAA